MIRSFCSVALVGLSLVSVQARAELPQTVSLTFDKVPVIQLLQATYRHMLNKNYIIDPSISADARAVTINVKDLPRASIKPTVDAVLSEAGIIAKDVGGISYFYPANRAAAPVLSTGVVDPLPTPSMIPVVAPGASSPVDQDKSAPGAVEVEETQFFLPRYRLPDQLQAIANAMLGTQFQANDTVVLAGSKKRVERVLAILEQYDTLPAEVSAKALVFEFQDGRSDGSSFQLALNVLAGKLSVGIGSGVTPLQTFARFKNSSIDAVLSAVSGDSRFKLLSAPSIRVRDGSKGRIVVGSDVPVLAEAQLDKNGNPVQSIQYRPSGVIFEIAPRIMRDRIELALLQQLSNFQQTGTSNINSPTLTKREVSTVVGLESGDMIVLGGLDETKETSTRSGLSFLPRTFDSNRSESTKSQVLVVLQVDRIGAPSSSIVGGGR